MVEPYIGEIRMFGGNFAPLHWTLCAGTLLPVTGNEALFSVLSNNFGGDGRSNFALPDLRGRIPIHQGQGAGLTSHNLGEQYGTEKVTLDVTQIPSHNHPMQATTNAGNDNSPQGRVPASLADGDVAYVEPTDETRIQAFSDLAVSEVGQGTSHSNLMPFLCVQFIIAMLGVFPPRN